MSTDVHTCRFGNVVLLLLVAGDWRLSWSKDEELGGYPADRQRFGSWAEAVQRDAQRLCLLYKAVICACYSYTGDMLQLDEKDADSKILQWHRYDAAKETRLYMATYTGICLVHMAHTTEGPDTPHFGASCPK
jgi:hypothetical protein